MKIEITDSAKNHVREIARISVRTAAKLLSAMQAMKDCMNLNDSLLDDRALEELEDGIIVSIKKWNALQRQGEDVWRLRLLNISADDIESYRVIYAFYKAGEIDRDPIIRVLAVLHRSEIDYDNVESETVTNIRDDYNNI